MDVYNFKNKYLSLIFENISKDQKQVFLHCDFEDILLNCNEQRTTNDISDLFASNS